MLSKTMIYWNITPHILSQYSATLTKQQDEVRREVKWANFPIVLYLWGGGAVAPNTDNPLGWALLMLSYFGKSYVEPMQYAVSSSLSRINGKLYLRLNEGLPIAANSRTNKVSITIPLPSLAWYLNTLVPVIGRTAVRYIDVKLLNLGTEIGKLNWSCSSCDWRMSLDQPVWVPRYHLGSPGTTMK